MNFRLKCDVSPSGFHKPLVDPVRQPLQLQLQLRICGNLIVGLIDTHLLGARH